MVHREEESAVVIRRADLDSSQDRARILQLLDHYAQHPLGQAAALSQEIRGRLMEALAAHPTTLIFLATCAHQEVGLAICFVGFSTFQATPLINIHDLIVREDRRGQGIGGALLDAVIQFARSQSYCAVTLEVRGDNPARRLYEKKGFQGLANASPEETMFFGKLDLNTDSQAR